MSTTIYIEDGRELPGRPDTLRKDIMQANGRLIGVPPRTDIDGLYVARRSNGGFQWLIPNDLVDRLPDSIHLTGNATDLPDTVGQLKTLNPAPYVS